MIASWSQNEIVDKFLNGEKRKQQACNVGYIKQYQQFVHDILTLFNRKNLIFFLNFFVFSSIIFYYNEVINM